MNPNACMVITDHIATSSTLINILVIYINVRFAVKYMRRKNAKA